MITPLASTPNSHGSLGRFHAVTVGDVSFGAEVLVDVDVHDVDAVLVVADERQQAVEDRPAVLRLAPRRRREQHGDGLARADHRVERRVCSGHIGSRVQIGSTPSGFVGVGDASVGADAPMVGASALRLHLEHERQLLAFAIRDAVPDAALSKTRSAT